MNTAVIANYAAIIPYTFFINPALNLSELKLRLDSWSFSKLV